MSGLYERQNRIEGINNKIKVLCIGAGGIGFWASRFLAMSGVEEITIFDMDTVEESNLNRLDLTNECIGRNKAELAASICKQIRPEGRFIDFPFPLSAHLYPKGVDYVIDCTDNMKSQLFHQKLATDNGAKYVKAGYNGTRMSLSEVIPQWDTSETPTEGGYTVTPSWVVPAVTIAALAVGKILKYHNADLGCDLGELYHGEN